MTLRRVSTLLLLTLAAGCAGDSGSASRDPVNPDPTPTPSADTFTAADAEALFNDAVLLALGGAPGVNVTRANDVVTITGTVVQGGGDVTFAELALDTRPFSPSGTASIASGDHTAAFLFAGSTAGTAVVDGAAAGTVTAAFPMTEEFAQAAADWAMDVAMNPNASFADPCPNLTVTDNGNGSFTLDGDCAVGGATVVIDMVTIDLANLAIDGTITLDDGNNNTAVIDFNGDTLDVTVNGNLVVDDQPIFAFLGP